MALYALIHGGGDSGGYWNHVKPLLEAAGHDVVAPDMPIDRDDATLNDCATSVIDAIGGELDDVIVVGMSFGGLVAPIVAERISARLLVFVAAMIPNHGDTFNTWFDSTGYERSGDDDFDEDAIFYHDVPDDVKAEAKTYARDHKSGTMNDPWPMPSLPDVPTRAVIGSIDRLFPREFMSKVVRDRLGIIPNEIESGHCIAQAKPHELAAQLEAYRAELGIGVRAGVA